MEFMPTDGRDWLSCGKELDNVRVNRARTKEYVYKKNCFEGSGSTHCSSAVARVRYMSTGNAVVSQLADSRRTGIA